MDLLIVGIWFGGVVGGAVIVVGAAQAVTRRSIFPFHWRAPGPSERQVVSIGL